MKRIARMMMSAVAVVLTVSGAMAQGKFDEQRMERDIEVAENVLGTIIKQQFEKRSFFPMEIEGNYTAGYGVTFRIPYEILGSSWFFEGPGGFASDGMDGSFTFRFDSDMEAPERIEAPERVEAVESREQAESEQVKARHYREDAEREKAKRTKNREQRESINEVEIAQLSRAGNDRRNRNGGKVVQASDNIDSMRNAYTNKIIEAAKNFIADYGDLISQLSPTEKITITNRGEGERIWYGSFANASTPSYLSVEAVKGDIVQYRQGKLTHDQLMAKMKVINSVMDDELNPDLELLSTIISRLYSPDLSTTYFAQENIYYERLKDFGVIYYMQVYSSNSSAYGNVNMPTLRLENVDPETRDKKVKELYPVFENEIKENILDYGRTLKSLKDDEVLMFNIKLTRCHECKIPSTLELSVKSSVLKEINSGKITKEEALVKITMKKGPNQ